MDWRIKGAIQKVLGVVPGGERAHYWLQRKGGGLKNFDREVAAKLEDFRLMVGHLASVGIDVAGARFLEIGTGWYPTFPFCLYALGAARVRTFDLRRHLKPELVVRVAERLAATPVDRLATPTAARAGEAPTVDRLAALVQRTRAGQSLEAATDGVVHYAAPADATRTGLGPGDVDVVFSNSVLEHVPPAVIDAMFAEAMRILPPGGVMFHSVNCGDHYAYADPRIDQLHYLQYSDAAWAKWNNAFLYQNRLRARDFTDAARAAGFTIEVDTSRPHPDRLRQLAAIAVHPRFARYPEDQLAITSIDFVARKPRAAQVSG